MARGEAIIAPGPSSLGRQVQVSEAIYREARGRLTEAIGGASYYSGTLDFEAEGLECRIAVALIVYRQRTSYPEGDVEEVRDLVPVWWEFHTFDRDGEVPNDFQFSKLNSFCLKGPVAKHADRGTQETP